MRSSGFMFASNGGVRLYYEVGGASSGAPLLMLRGLGRTSHHWGELRTLLEAHFRLIVMDNRGVGASHAPLPPYSTAIMADDAASVLEHAGVASAAVFGISLGGMIAQELCLRHPHRVSRLILCATRAGGKHAVPTSLAASMRLAAALFMPERRALEYTAPIVLSAAFLAANRAVVADWQRIAREQPTRRRGFLGQLSAALRHDTAERLERIAVPVLVTSGDADRLIDVANSQKLAAAIPQATLIHLSGAGHDVAVERPRELADLVREFLR